MKKRIIKQQGTDETWHKQDSQQKAELSLEQTGKEVSTPEMILAVYQWPRGEEVSF